MTKNEPREKRIEDIIRAALEEFLEKGYEGASMEAIARRANMSKGGLYHHFNSKDEILLACNQKLDEPLNQLRQQTEKISSASRALTWYVKKYLEYWINHEREIVFYSLSMTKVLDSPGLWKMYETYIENSIDFFRNLFQRGIDAGEFMDHSANESALTFMSALDGVVFYVIIDRKLKLDEIVTLFEKKFISGLKIGRP
jgi:AcrR family transcriptional regulator